MSRADWDELAGEFETGACDIAREETGQSVQRFVNAVPLPKNAVLVDLGCGIGSVIRKFGPQFREIMGVEFAPRIIARAKERCAEVPGTAWFTMDIPRAAKAIGPRADLTVCFNVITQVSAAKRAALWASVAAVTKRRGHAIVVVPSLEAARMIDRLTNARGVTALHPGGLVDRDGALQKHFARKELDEIFAAYGFRLKRVARAYYPWSKEGVRETKLRRENPPWDWICLAQKL